MPGGGPANGAKVTPSHASISDVIISIFGDTVVKAGMEEDEATLDARLEPVLRGLPGFISYKTYVAEDGEADWAGYG